ncbi:hypothetical protein RHGRI_010978 [Rhododendron griersonianum]|uniref:Uncharacterized protein n=1 Tax=Rhododendron griersonianum TaxID=479676 RepID=A0AAV6KL12_9ERIC|nr:hypothetical protein RHGRI_010978 [Rhododendron griersonianum]
MSSLLDWLSSQEMMAAQSRAVDTQNAQDLLAVSLHLGRPRNLFAITQPQYSDYKTRILPSSCGSSPSSTRRGLSCVGDAMTKLMELFITVGFRQNQEQSRGRAMEYSVHIGATLSALAITVSRQSATTMQTAGMLKQCGKVASTVQQQFSNADHNSKNGLTK